MKNYIGTKQVQAKPMNRLEYNQYRGWVLPADENPHDEGYLVKYPSGYISWSPKSEFESTYTQTNGLTFGLALEALKQQKNIAREHWYNSFLFIADGSKDLASRHHYGYGEYLNEPKFLDAIYLKTNTNDLIPWFPTTQDLLATNWIII